VEFTVNNKVYMVTKLLPFIANYRRKRKIEKVTKFVERIKKVQEEIEAVLRKMQEDMKR